MARIAFPVVLSAPSGTGKTTLAHLLVNSVSNLHVSVSYTTRPIRGNEREGVEYHFVPEAQFKEEIDKNAFLEWANVHGSYYGSSMEMTQKELHLERDVVFDIDVQGGLQIKAAIPNSVLIFILPPSLAVLEARLRGRGTEKEEVIQKRLAAARSEIEIGLNTYDYVINNEILDRALFDLTAIIRAHRLMGIDREKIRKRLLG
jgi:guanylate kinase